MYEASNALMQRIEERARARQKGGRGVVVPKNSINTHDGIGASVLICCLFISTFNTNKQAQQTKPSACAFLHLKKSTLPLNVLPPRECPSLVRDPPDGESGYLDALHLPSVAAIVATTSVRSPRGNWFKKVHQLVGVKPAHERFLLFCEESGLCEDSVNWQVCHLPPRGAAIFCSVLSEYD